MTPHRIGPGSRAQDRKSTRLNSSHTVISYAVFCLKKKEHKYELESHSELVCRLLVEKKRVTCVEDSPEERGRWEQVWRDLALLEGNETHLDRFRNLA